LKKLKDIPNKESFEFEEYHMDDNSSDSKTRPPDVATYKRPEKIKIRTAETEGIVMPKELESIASDAIHPSTADTSSVADTGFTTSSSSISSSHYSVLDFRGHALEYFKIWIVNVIFTVCTLGIYSAWAKVRTRRYFYGNTFLENSNFDYHASPMRILIGRLIMGSLFLSYTIGMRFFPVVAPITFSIIMLLISPWLIVRGMIFNLSNTSYKGLRFGFKKNYEGSYNVMFKSAAVTIFTLGFGFPYSHYRWLQFTTNNSRFGQTEFNTTLSLRTVFGIYYAAAGIYILSLAAFMAFSLIKSTPLLVIGMIVLYLGFGCAYVYVRSRIYNELFNSTKLGTTKLKSKFVFKEYFFISVTNFMGIVFSLGLAYPWAKIRMAQYFYNHIAIRFQPAELDQFVAGETQKLGASADAALDFWDIDIGI
jgi:uncharacterized membrane protein YjgN (DUF898 family)